MNYKYKYLIEKLPSMKVTGYNNVVLDLRKEKPVIEWDEELFVAFMSNPKYEKLYSYFASRLIQFSSNFLETHVKDLDEYVFGFQYKNITVQVIESAIKNGYYINFSKLFNMMDTFERIEPILSFVIESGNTDMLDASTLLLLNRFDLIPKQIEKYSIPTLYNTISGELIKSLDPCTAGWRRYRKHTPNLTTTHKLVDLIKIHFQYITDSDGDNPTASDLMWLYNELF